MGPIDPRDNLLMRITQQPRRASPTQPARFSLVVRLCLCLWSRLLFQHLEFGFFSLAQAEARQVAGVFPLSFAIQALRFAVVAQILPASAGVFPLRQSRFFPPAQQRLAVEFPRKVACGGGAVPGA